ncbi:hypothetical protein [Emticicia fluvialis]|uniref:hypothetical protein n=1 Tax=Emticicia fluvialis TaxID=2974474 RepID=UPI0021659347|nr:hypothetical protein [Emticicia fluvialis]
MKQILAKLAFLILILLVIDKLFGVLFTHFIFKKTISGERGGTINYILQKNRDINFLILGSSRARHQIDPLLLTNLKGKGYNAGENAVGGVLYSSILLDLLLAQQIRPHSVILQMDANYFDESRQKQNNLELRALYPFYAESALLKEYVKEIGWKETMLVQSDMFKYNFKVYPIMFNYINEKNMINPFGFSPLLARLDTSKIRHESVKHKVEPIKLDNLKLKALRHLINQCAKFNVKLYIVFPPNFKNIYYHKVYSDKLKAFASAQKTPARVIDMSDVYKLAELQQPDKWKDETHLNKAGALLFSAYLNDSLKENINRKYVSKFN